MQQQYNPKNEQIYVWIGDKLFPRHEAKVSVFDSVVQGGDAVWEGLRVYNGNIFCLKEHLNRLHDSAHAMLFQNIPTKEFIQHAINETLLANGMRNDAHIRLTLTRGEKITSGMDPRLNQKGCTLIVLAEWKRPVYGDNGIKLITSSVRRNSPQNLDSKIHHNNLINNILAKIEANIAGADDALMLDNFGFVAETNACNIFMMRNGKIYTPHADACLPGITRKIVIEIAKEENLHLTEKNISLTEMYTADEVFTTGTMGELVAVTEIDGRKIINKNGTLLLQHLQEAYRRKISRFDD
ncbi:MAG: aminotransferase class IV [Bacteroidetes bacterium]|nr:aminotransferase class IV [Bacteroidota bacterium]MBK8681341.1 aminotransferase class IV [Bacteroidota bacterium]